jgi:hypothetical protein
MTPQQVCSKLVNKLWQCCSNNLPTRCILNRLVASLLTSCDNAVPTTCQQDVFAIHSQKRASCNKLVDNLEQTCYQQADIRMRSHGLRQLVHNKSVPSCQQTWCKLSSTDLMQVVVNRLDASCHEQTWCKLSSTDLMQVVTNRLDASCHEQTWCKLSRTDLMQVVTNRLDASCREQTWCKLPSEESALWSFVYALFWTKNGQTDCHISVVVFRKITRLLYTDQLAR